MTASKTPAIDNVAAFWNDNPLCGFETPHRVGTPEFFAWHHAIRDAQEGQFCRHLYEFNGHAGEEVLDIGCGVGWLVWNFARGGANITGVDLSEVAVETARMRLEQDGLTGTVRQGNAEALPFEDDTFDFVTSAGVLHHTPDTQRAVNEALRVLKPGGRAMISLYYRNWALSPAIWPITRFGLHHVVGAVPGRKYFREVRTVEDFARIYDGDDNPVGKIYTEREFRELLSGFAISNVEFHYFPTRFLPFPIAGWLHRLLDRWLGLMIYAELEKR